MSENPVDVSILIISYNTREMTLECIESILEQTTSHSFQIIVLDNDSKDGSPEAIAERFPDVHLIASKVNHGFAYGNNVASRESLGRRTLLLNPDTVILDRAIDKLLDFADTHPEHRLWGGRHCFADGSMNSHNCFMDYSVWSTFCSCLGVTRIFTGSPLFNPRPYPGYDRMSIKEVDVITGCYLLIDTDMWEKLGGFDEDFFMFAEEVDLCHRARDNGANPIIFPDSLIIHHGGGSAPARSLERRIQLFRAERQYYRKHMGKFRAFLACLFSDIRIHRLALLGSIKQLITRKKNEEASLELIRRRQEWG